MSKRAYDLLQQAGLLDKDDRPADLSGFDEAVLRGKLDYYHKSRADGAEAEVAKERAGRGEFATLRSSISSSPEISRLLPSALVCNRLYVDDPLFREVGPRDEISHTYNQFFGLQTDTQIDREQIAESLRYFADVAPLVRAGLCSVMPISLLHKPPKAIPLLASEDGFASAVPESVRELVHEAALVHEVMPLPDGGLAILTEPPNEPTRGIQIAFAGDQKSRRSSMVYTLSEMRAVGPPKGDRFKLQMTLDWDKKPSQEKFDIWVAQSINKTALNRLAAVSSELHLADGLNATYVTESEFESRLLGLNAGDIQGSLQENAVNFLTATAPFVGAASPEAVVGIRLNHPVLFEKFQASLLHVASQLVGVDADYEEKARALYVKEVEPQVRDINAQFSKIAWQGTSSCMLATAATFSFALSKTDALPFSVPLAIAFAGVAVIQGFAGVLPSVGDYLQKRKGPAFIWSKLAKS